MFTHPRSLYPCSPRRFPINGLPCVPWPFLGSGPGNLRVDTLQRGLLGVGRGASFPFLLPHCRTFQGRSFPSQGLPWVAHPSPNNPSDLCATPHSLTATRPVRSSGSRAVKLPTCSLRAASQHFEPRRCLSCPPSHLAQPLSCHSTVAPLVVGRWSSRYILSIICLWSH